ncbi:unnamed protein product, partial [Mesorhabditis belari]|uniref:Cation efflux protein cytoplasmic domain-containing protein n=1 Tax=Mesorhabditis belari TaxID=2138241 RepID=A0AAF3FCM0_9BILA
MAARRKPSKDEDVPKKQNGFPQLKSHEKHSKHSHATKENPKCFKYYERQEALLEAYKLDEECILNGGPLEDKEEATKADQWVSTVVLLINIALLFAKAFSTWLTHGSSLSIISTLLDSVVDITSGVAVWYATHLIIHTDLWHYPRGRENLENMALLFLSAVMGLANLQVVWDSIKALIFGKPPPDITPVSLFILFSTIIIKIFLYLWCSKRNSKSAQVLATDQRNDVVTNSVVIIGAALSEYVAPVADPITAAFVSGYIAWNWMELVKEQMHQLLGGNCSPEELSRVAKVCISEKHVRCLDALLVYHAGNKVRVEVHVVTDPEMTLRQIHDELIEPLTTKLESLEFVDKAFVHPDHALDGKDK